MKYLIKVKCISPFDETWEKGKVYTCEKWHHGDLNMDFWDVYYDYDNNPKYVQFSSIEMLEKEFAILRNDTIEVKEVDLVEEFADFLEKENAYVDDNNIISYYNGSSFNHTCDIYPIAKHFFELGLNARKEE